MLYTWTFWILAVWFVVNVIWMWFVRDQKDYQKTFAWINVVALIWGWWVYFGAAPVAALTGWLMAVNIANIVVAILQFYYGYSTNNANHNQTA
ncbi:hypothetical protein GNF18_02395 [Ligilactobacillus pobuzihii]|uniref:hypothetical protein n=1 Tax=Ligilactobacillus pobuzihii TaxID=449659 RepID=UPI0019D2FD50|nr:hypothetical protein [Ligilactobacillus pobuzihii]MBN7274024.1 hypothetical protein [Ligilactobacillus pobuzihii]